MKKDPMISYDFLMKIKNIITHDHNNDHNDRNGHNNDHNDHNDHNGHNDDHNDHKND